MSASSYYILGDWGTSSCRLYLCKDGEVQDTRRMPGIKFCADLEAEFLEGVADWTAAHGPLTSVLCGMVGANIGWRDAGYAACPARGETLAEMCLSFPSPAGDVYIVPGVLTPSNPAGLPDRMRGEETQIMGWMSGAHTDALVCLPGTHTKWVVVKDGRIINFITSFTGELFETLASYSVLLGKMEWPEAERDEAFCEGVKKGAEIAHISHLLFSVRARQISGEYSPHHAKNYLLGLLIGHDVQAARDIMGHPPDVIIGGEGPAAFYAHALQVLGYSSTIYDGQKAVCDGLEKIYNDLIRT